MKIIIYIGLLILLCKCNGIYNKDLKVEVMSNKEKKDFLNIQDSYFLNEDSIKIANLYLYKSLGVENSDLISHRLYQFFRQKNRNGEVELSFHSGGPSSPFLAASIILTIKKEYKYQIEMECMTDVNDEVIMFDSIKQRCKYGVLYITDSIYSKSNKIYGFLNIEVFKDDKFKELDYKACLSFPAN